jgi:isopentenyl-diphosphate delta-isomerase
MNDLVILVDENDSVLGIMDKMEAHVKGLLHRAFSVFIFNDKNEMLLHQRAKNKYHSPGLWTNTCCSHPRPGEETIAAAQRRLMEEMGFSCELKECFQFTYNAVVGRGLTEHEFDHVFTGIFNGIPNINSLEVANWRYADIDSIKKELEMHPERFTVWFKIAFYQLIERGIPAA